MRNSMAEDNIPNIQDEVLQNASLEAKRCGNTMPFIKVELQCKIQCRRLARGQDELDLRMSSPPRKKQRVEVTKEELERMDKRKEQNRKPARKFREKGKREKEKIAQTIKDLRKRNEELRTKVQQMEPLKANISHALGLTDRGFDET